MDLNNIRIVLIETSHPGNIGAAARAMMTMGLSDLYLVKPKKFPSEKAVAMSSGATGILKQAHVVDSVVDAIADCQVVIGTSARSQRYIRWPIMSARECGEYVSEQASEEGGNNKVAILFGRERTGLTNEELEYCHSLVNIPVNPNFSSLNVAAAVQVISYEIAMGADLYSVQLENDDEKPVRRTDELVTADDMEGFYQHLQRMLIKVDYLDPEKPRLLMRRLRKLFGRMHLVRSELNILRGICSACEGSKFKPRSERE